MRKGLAFVCSEQTISVSVMMPGVVANYTWSNNWYFVIGFEIFSCVYSSILYLSLRVGYEEFNKSVAEVLLISECASNLLQTLITERGNNGWKLVAFEAFPINEFDLGVEYSYRMIWERPK